MTEQHGIAPDARCYSSIISALGKAGMWREALQQLNAMQQPAKITRRTSAPAAGIEPGTWVRPAVKPDVVCYTGAIQALAIAGEAKRALILFATMKASGVQPDKMAYHAVLGACEGEQVCVATCYLLSQLHRVLSLVLCHSFGNDSAQDFCRCGLQHPYVATCRHVCVSVCAHVLASVTASLAAHHLHTCSAHSVPPPPFSCMYTLREPHQGQWIEALRLLRKIPPHMADAWTYNAVIRACEIAGRWREPVAVLDTMRKSRDAGSNSSSTVPHPDRVTYNLVISAVAKAGRWEHALSLFEELKACGPGDSPRSSSLDAVLSKRSSSSTYNAQQEGAKGGPNAVTYGLLASAACACGRADEGVVLLDHAWDAGIKLECVCSVRMQMHRAAVLVCAVWSTLQWKACALRCVA